MSASLGIALVLQFVPAASGAGIVLWNTESIPESGTDVIDVSLAFDTLGVPHITFFDDGGNHLTLLRKHGGFWSADTVDDDVDVGRNSSIAIGSDNLPQISYYHRTVQLKYAKAMGQSWLIEAPAPMVDDEGAFSSIALDAGDAPHVSFRNVTDLTLWYAERASGAWTFEPVDTTTATAFSTSIALDSNGDPHVAYTQTSPWRLMYATKSGGNWTIETIDSTGTPTGNPRCIAIDSFGVPHVAYAEGGTGDLGYATRTGGVWSSEIALEGVGGLNVGHEASLALDASDTPHISHIDFGSSDLVYTSKEFGAWSSQTVDTGPVENSTAIALDLWGNPGIAYRESPGTAQFAYGLFTSDVERPRLRVSKLRIHPNPSFSGRSEIGFGIAGSAEPARVRLSVHDLSGRTVRVLASGAFGSAQHRIAWDGIGADGTAAAPGLYFVRLQVNGRTEAQGRIAVLR